MPNELKSDLGIVKNDSLVLVEPAILGKPNIIRENLKERYIKYFIDFDFDFAKIESAQKIAKAKSEKGVQINLQIGYGLNSNADEIYNLYQTPSKSEYLNFGINVPIVNWKENYKIFKIQTLLDENIKSQYNIQKNKVEDNIDSLILSLNELYNQIDYSKMSLEIAIKNSAIAENLLLMKRLTINNFNEETFKEEKGIIDLLSSNRSIWLYKYYLRKTVLYDFFENIELISKK